VNPDRWQQLKVLFEKAMELDTRDREAYLDEACSKDPSLRHEVVALLDRHSQDSFLEKPAYEAVPELFENAPTEKLIGCALGPYEIISKIGSGGMGVVFLGRDTRLDRSVAIKMLTSLDAGDNRQRERLQWQPFHDFGICTRSHPASNPDRRAASLFSNYGHRHSACPRPYRST
jgi:hypothetical protein